MRHNCHTLGYYVRYMVAILIPIFLKKVAVYATSLKNVGINETSG